jgi:hypothetical protein
MLVGLRVKCKLFLSNFNDIWSGIMLIKCISITFNGNSSTCLQGNRRTNMGNLTWKLCNFSLRPLLEERRGLVKFLIIICVAPQSVYALDHVWFRNKDKAMVVFMSLFRGLLASTMQDRKKRTREIRIMWYNRFIMIRFECVMEDYYCRRRRPKSVIYNWVKIPIWNKMLRQLANWWSVS